MKGKLFALLAVFAVMLMGFATTSVQGAEKAEKRVMLTTDKFQYDVGEKVTFVITNIGETFSYSKWKIDIWNATSGEYVYSVGEKPSGVLKPQVLPDKLERGDRITWTWDQTYYIVWYMPEINDKTQNDKTQEVTYKAVYDERNGQQVPEGTYQAQVTFYALDGAVKSNNATFIIGKPDISKLIPELDIPQLG